MKQLQGATFRKIRDTILNLPFNKVWVHRSVLK